MIYLSCLLLILAIGLLYFAVRSRYSVVVMMYHNVENSDAVREDTVSPANFEYHLKFLKSHGYRVLTLDEYCKGLGSGIKFRNNCVVLTFDDGKKNNYTRAYPLLKKYGIGATFFVSPGTVGNDDSMTWDEIIEMREGGMSFGSHGMVQAYLPSASRSVQVFEIQESKKILESRLQDKIYFYAYPVGGFTGEIKEILKQSGYRAAVTTNRGSSPQEQDLFEIRRIRFGDRDISGMVLWAKLSGYYNLFRSLKKPSQ